MLINSHAISNVHEAVAIAIIEEVTMCDLQECDALDPSVIDDAIKLAKASGFESVIDDIRQAAEEFNYTEPKSTGKLPEWMV